jgi:hypothetical protein
MEEPGMGTFDIAWLHIQQAAEVSIRGHDLRRPLPLRGVQVAEGNAQIVAGDSPGTGQPARGTDEDARLRQGG